MSELVDVSRDRQPKSNPLDRMSQSELIKLRSEIDQHLQNRTLADLNLEQELLSQYTVTKQLLAEVLDDLDTPANQKAQVVNSLLAITNQLVKMQTDLHTAERIKAMESACVKAIKTLEPQAQEEFFKRYQDYYAQSGTQKDTQDASTSTLG